MCVIRLELWLNALVQTAHLWGFSPAINNSLRWFGTRHCYCYNIHYPGGGGRYLLPICCNFDSNFMMLNKFWSNKLWIIQFPVPPKVGNGMPCPLQLKPTPMKPLYTWVMYVTHHICLKLFLNHEIAIRKYPMKKNCFLKKMFVVFSLP